MPSYRSFLRHFLLPADLRKFPPHRPQPAYGMRCLVQLWIPQSRRAQKRRDHRRLRSHQRLRGSSSGSETVRRTGLRYICAGVHFPPRDRQNFSEARAGSGINRSAAEFMQYRKPVGSGPSVKTCPKCASQSAHFTSVRNTPALKSFFSRTFSAAMASQKLGQPVPESNFAFESKSALPQSTQR